MQLINIDAGIVSRALRTLDSFISSTTNSTANALRVYTEDGTLRLERNDYETIVSYDTGISVPDDVADTYIPATLTGSILRSITGVVAVYIKDELVSFGHHRGQFTVKKLTEVDWPTASPVETTPLGVDSGAFARALGQVAVSISTDRYRPNLSGAHVENRDGYIVLSSTDSYRMSQVTIPGTVNFTGILPGNIVHGLTGYLSGEDSLDVAIGMSELSAQVVAGKLSVTTRLVHATFPDLGTVLTKAQNNPNQVVLPRKETIEALRQTVLLFDKERPKVGMEIDVDEGEAFVRFTSTSAPGDAESYVHGDVKDGDPFSIQVNPAYLIAGLERFDSEVVRLSSSKDGRGTCALTSDDDNFVYLFMPYMS